MRGGLIVATAALLGGGVALAQRGGQAPQPDDVVVTATDEVVVNGRARRCHPIAGDPLGHITLSTLALSGERAQSVVKPDGRGGWMLQPDDEPVTGPQVWQRAGRGLDGYVYRDEGSARPMCIGAVTPDRGTFAQFRRIVPSKPYIGHRVRFTAWVASGQAGMVRLWLAAGRGTSVLAAGGNTNNRSWGGNHGWTPMMIEVGPVHRVADHLSYGFLLQGAGDVWVWRPELSIVPDGEPHPRKGDVSVFGSSEP